MMEELRLSSPKIEPILPPEVEGLTTQFSEFLQTHGRGVISWQGQILKEELIPTLKYWGPPLPGEILDQPFFF